MCSGAIVTKREGLSFTTSGNSQQSNDQEE